jgi:hypothetical protein
MEQKMIYQMANTRMTAPNTFTKGLVMDFNPTVTKSDSLVNALNATLLTFNGNEMQLQQDMGNGRVETARLPEGYVPVGSCEFGDIIYIVSYNPLENKSQIGCFPSPERNVSIDEVTSMQQGLRASDFQEMKGQNPTGVVKAMSVKRIVYGNRNLNPGDKYVIYEEGSADIGKLKSNGNTLSDYGTTTHRHGEWPKLLKLKVVSIEDSGRIVDLNASVKWYDNDYYIASLQKTADSSKPDLDSYRSLVTSAYSVFQSKVSGKLALLAELETIDGFNCTYEVYPVKGGGGDTMTYKIYFYTSWDTGHNDVNPVGFAVTGSSWGKEVDSGHVYEPFLGNDGHTVNFKKSPLQHAVPVSSAAVVDPDGTIVGYDFTKVMRYTRTYELEIPSASFRDYLSNDSFNAKVPDIVDWGKESGSYTALKNQSDYGNIRPVTRVTRLLDPDTGEPAYSNGGYKYVYNLDSYMRNVDNSLTFKTKGLDGQNLEVLPLAIKDDVINNHFHKDVPTLLTDKFSLPIRKELAIGGKPVKVDTDLSRMVWNYKVSPVMPYGVLDHLELAGNIDFSKLGTGHIDLKVWKYYNSGNVATLTWGLEAYTESNKGIAEVCMDFYDNQGCAASYHVIGKSSYSGSFTESIILGQQNSSYKLNAVDVEGHSYIHAGVEDASGKVYLTPGNKPVTDKTGNLGPYKNDAGTLYPNMLYLVRITVKYCPKDMMGNYNTFSTAGYRTFYRWMWTNAIFNEHFYSIPDFNVLQPQLGLDFSATFDTRGKGGIHPLTPHLDTYMGNLSFKYAEDKDRLYKTLGASVYSVNQDGSDDQKGNVLMTLNPGLSEGYGTFNLNSDKLHLVDDIKVMMGKSYITKSVGIPEKKHSGDKFDTPLDDTIQPVVAKRLYSHHDLTGFDRSGYASYNYGTNNCIVSDSLLKVLQHRDTPIRPDLTSYGYLETKDSLSGSASTELYSSASAYENYLDSFSLNLLSSTVERTKTLKYLNDKGDEQSISDYQVIRCSLNDVMTEGNPNKAIKLVLAGTAYSKMFASQMKESKDGKVLKSLLHLSENENKFGSAWPLGLRYFNGQLFFNNVTAFFMGRSASKNHRWGASSTSSLIQDFWHDPGTRVKYNLHLGGHKKGGDEWYYLFDDSVQSELKSHGRFPISAMMFARPNVSGAGIRWIQSEVKFGHIRYAFELNALDNLMTSSEGDTPISQIEYWSSGGDVEYVHCLLAYDEEQDLMVPLADYFISSGSKQLARHAYSQTKGKTLASRIGGFLMQLYVVDPNITTSIGVLHNHVSLQNFSEYWNKDIIVEADMEGTLSSQDKVQELLTIQKQTIARYLTLLKSNAGNAYQNDKVAVDNVTFRLLSVKRVFSFKYEVPYDVSNLSLAYENGKEVVHRVELCYEVNNEPQYGSFVGEVLPNTLYTWQDGSLLPFGQGSKMVFASSFSDKEVGGVKRLFLHSSGEPLPSGDLAVLSKILSYKDGNLSWRNFSKLPNWNTRYYVKWEGTSGGSTFLTGFPMISLFKDYTPR